jgi:hypothetical protein
MESLPIGVMGLIIMLTTTTTTATTAFATNEKDGLTEPVSRRIAGSKRVVALVLDKRAVIGLLPS